MQRNPHERIGARGVPYAVLLLLVASFLGGCATNSRAPVPTQSELTQPERSEGICGSSRHIDYDSTAGEQTAREAILVWVDWLRNRVEEGPPANEEHSAPAQLLVLEAALAAMERGELDSRAARDGVIAIAGDSGAEVGAIDIDPTMDGRYVLSMIAENSSPCDYRLAGE